jgi:hypothetical protein
LGQDKGKRVIRYAAVLNPINIVLLIRIKNPRNIDNNCTDGELQFGMPGGSGDFEDEGDESYTITTASRRRRAATELERFDLGTSDVYGYEGEDGDDSDANEEE